MRYRYTVELTVDELDFSATEAEHLRAALREAAEEYATGEVKVLCEDGWCIEKNDARIDAVKAEYTKSAEPLQKRVKQLETDVQEYVEAHREDMAGKSRQLTFGRVGFRQSTRLILANAKVPQAIATLLAMGRRELVKTEQKLDKEALKQQPEEVLEAVGAYLKTTDEFFYDTGDAVPEE